jgi:ubiquitin carboxyl-terminal hydrolase MINDY-1/2
MDLNPVFTSPTSFRPSGSMGGGGELKLFEHVGIPLVHGWVVDPESTDADVLERISDYDAAVELIAEVDHLTNGKFVMTESDEISPACPSSPADNWTEEGISKVADGMWFRVLSKS